jgi:hypothetical protein
MPELTPEPDSTGGENQKKKIKLFKMKYSHMIYQKSTEGVPCSGDIGQP